MAKKTKGPKTISPKDIWDVPENSEDLAVTVRMLKLVENQLESRFDSTDSKIERMEVRLDARIDQLELKMDQWASEIKSEVARLGVLMEQQRSENRIVLDAFMLLRDKFVDVDRRVARLETKAGF